MKNHIKLYEEYTSEDFKFLTTEKEVNEWCMYNGIRIRGHMNPDGGYMSYSSVNMQMKKIERLPFKFEVVKGNLLLNDNNLYTLEGCPEKIAKDPNSMSGQGLLAIYGNRNLKTLEYCPKVIQGIFTAHGCGLETLIYAPKQPDTYYENPCSKIYDELGWTDEAHAQSLIQWHKKEPEAVVAFLERMKEKSPFVLTGHINKHIKELYDSLMSHKELRIVLGLEDSELKDAYKTSVDVEEDFY